MYEGHSVLTSNAAALHPAAATPSSCLPRLLNRELLSGNCDGVILQLCSIDLFLGFVVLGSAAGAACALSDHCGFGTTDLQTANLNFAQRY